jgi:hypothetical protein
LPETRKIRGHFFSEDVKKSARFQEGGL